MMRSWLLLLAPLLMAQTSPQPLVPEGVHQFAQGPSTVCGVTASAAQEFESKIKGDTHFRHVLTTERFVAYATADSFTQWTFSLPGNTAHPLATCRHTYQGSDGAWYMQRQLRCDDTRDRCDRAFLEFRELDDRVKQALSGRERG